MKQVSVEANLRHQHRQPMSIDVGREIATSRASMDTVLASAGARSGSQGRYVSFQDAEHIVSPERNALVLASPGAIREHWGRGSFLSGACPTVWWSYWRLGASDRSCTGGRAGFHAASHCMARAWVARRWLEIDLGCLVCGVCGWIGTLALVRRARRESSDHNQSDCQSQPSAGGRGWQRIDVSRASTPSSVLPWVVEQRQSWRYQTRKTVLGAGSFEGVPYFEPLAKLHNSRTLQCPRMTR
jgi:hypothetical protein